jgi:GT2 family glycosyltransferase
VDNDSSDGTLGYIRALIPECITHRNAVNRGFAAANNQGIALSHGRYFLLLNPDTILRSGACDRLIEFMDLHPEVSACGPALLNGDGSPQRTGVTFPSLWNLFVEALFLDRLFPRSRLFGAHRKLYTDPEVPRKVDYVQGSCLLVRRETVEKVGALDEAFFMYFEETDWCKRIKDSGGEVWYVPGAKVFHFGGSAFGHYDERRLVAYHRSLLLFFEKHHAAWEGFVLRGIVLIRSAVRLLAWGILGLLPGDNQRARSRSAVRGYARVFTMMFRGRSAT